VVCPHLYVWTDGQQQSHGDRPAPGTDHGLLPGEDLRGDTGITDRLSVDLRNAVAVPTTPSHIVHSEELNALLSRVGASLDG
jgi:hypothetical protein